MNLREEDNLSTKDKRLEFILFPKCPLFGGLTVLHSTEKKKFPECEICSNFAHLEVLLIILKCTL